MGGGGEGFAFVLDADFYSGGTYRSETFGNPILAAEETFRVRNVEVWGFEAFVKKSLQSRSNAVKLGTYRDR
jgi:hypothetical protein